MKAIFKLSRVLLCLVMIAVGCGKDDNSIELPDSVEQRPDPVEESPDPVEESTDPSLGDISPLAGPQKADVTIRGSNFGDDPSKVRVFFNGKEALLESVSDTVIKTVVPSRAYSGNIKVFIDGTELLGPPFNYIITGVRVSTFAGGDRGFFDGIGLSAKFKFPYNGVFDQEGNLYVTDSENYKIRKITPHKVVSTFAGSTNGYEDGDAHNAKFGHPIGIAIDQNGNLYVSDAGYHVIRKISPAGNVSTLAGDGTKGNDDGMGPNARFDWPMGIAVDHAGNVYVADSGNDRIRKITPEGRVTTLAGGIRGDSDGIGNNAGFYNPYGVIVDAQGSVYVADTYNHKIRKVTAEGEVTTIAGTVKGFEDGTIATAKFEYPQSLAMDSLGTIYVSDTESHKIRSINGNGTVSTLVGIGPGFDDGLHTVAKFYEPIGMAIDKEGFLYVMDKLNHKIRIIRKE